MFIGISFIRSLWNHAPLDGEEPYYPTEGLASHSKNTSVCLSMGVSVFFTRTLIISGWVSLPCFALLFLFHSVFQWAIFRIEPNPGSWIFMLGSTALLNSPIASNSLPVCALTRSTYVVSSFVNDTWPPPLEYFCLSSDLIDLCCENNVNYAASSPTRPWAELWA